MYGCQSIDRLDFDNDPIGDDEVEPVMAQQVATIHDGDVLFGFKWYSRRMKLDANCSRTRILEQAGPEFAMDVDAAANRLPHRDLDFARQRGLYSQHGTLLRVFVPSWLLRGR
jgi:hypothetical protein